MTRARTAATGHTGRSGSRPVANSAAAGQRAGSAQVWVEMAGQTVTAGRLYSHRHCGTESASFAYEPGYLSNPCAYALDPALPLLLGTQQAPLGQSIFGAFSDSCPDRWGRRLIERAERRRAETEGATARSFGHFDPHVDFPEDCCQGSFPARLGPAPGDPVGAGAPARRSSSIACRFSQPW